MQVNLRHIQACDGSRPRPLAAARRNTRLQHRPCTAEAASQHAPGMRPLQWRDDGSSTPRFGGKPSAPAQQLQQQVVRLQPQPSGQVAPGQRGRQPAALRRCLKPDDFRHPLDRQNTQLLRGLPGVEMVAKSIMGGRSRADCFCSVHSCTVNSGSRPCSCAQVLDLELLSRGKSALPGACGCPSAQKLPASTGSFNVVLLTSAPAHMVSFTI
jgi:hypothetical protein